MGQNLTLELQYDSGDMMAIIYHLSKTNKFTNFALTSYIPEILYIRFEYT